MSARSKLDEMARGGYRVFSREDAQEIESRITELEAALLDLLPWAENWLPDEAKDQGARESYKAARAVLGKK